MHDAPLSAIASPETQPPSLLRCFHPSRPPLPVLLSHNHPSVPIITSPAIIKLLEEGGQCLNAAPAWYAPRALCHGPVALLHGLDTRY